MSGIKPKARDRQADLENKTSGTVKPDAKRGEQGIVLDERAQEQPIDGNRVQDHDRPAPG